MNIKDISKLAGVSVGTVSKIINGKDSAISEDTRKRVLDIVKKYNYVPYAHAIKKQSVKKYIIGLLLDGNNYKKSLIESFLKYASEKKYQVIVNINHNCDEELQSITSMCKNQVDGVVWQRISKESEAYKKHFDQCDIEVINSDLHEPIHETNITLPYEEYARMVTDITADKGHVRIALLTTDNEKSDLYYKGYLSSLHSKKIDVDERLNIKWTSEFLLSELIISGVSAIVCENEYIMSDVIRQASLLRVRIPDQLSVLYMSESTTSFTHLEDMSHLSHPIDKLGEILAEAIIALVEKTTYKHSVDDLISFTDVQGNSVSRPYGNRQAKIVVVGNINYDTLINIEKVPNVGETTIIKEYVQLPGGKGANQAVAASRLGAESYLIGMVGKDHEALILFNELNTNKVHIDGVRADKYASTGRAIVHIQDNGESSISVFRGANAKLSKPHIDEYKDFMRDASYCLLQLEMQQDLVEYTAEVASQYGARVILKPSTVKSINEKLLINTSILLPNEKEINTLCPGKSSYYQKALKFVNAGVETVIVTLGKNGCLLCEKERVVYFPSFVVNTVDSTGAADAFAAALSVFLSENNNMYESIKAATVAAGLSTTKKGVQSGLVSRTELENYIDSISSLKYWEGDDIKALNHELWLV